MPGPGQGVEREPAELVELVRLAEAGCGRVEAYGEDDRDPVRAGTQNVADAEQVDGERRGRVLLGDLAGDRRLEGLAELERAGAAVPGARLVAGPGGTTREQELSAAVVQTKTQETSGRSMTIIFSRRATG